MTLLKNYFFDLINQYQITSYYFNFQEDLKNLPFIYNLNFNNNIYDLHLNYQQKLNNHKYNDDKFLWPILFNEIFVLI